MSPPGDDILHLGRLRGLLGIFQKHMNPSKSLGSSDQERAVYIHLMLPWVFPDGITSSCLVLDLANYFCLSLPQKHRSTPCTLAPPLQLSCFLELASNISLCYIQNNNVSGIQSFIHLCCIQSFFHFYFWDRVSSCLPGTHYVGCVACLCLLSAPSNGFCFVVVFWNRVSNGPGWFPAF